MSLRDYEDFTEKHYSDILNAAKKHYKFVFFDKPTDTPHVIWRHDLDMSVHHALKLAHIEKKCGVRSTYFLRLHSSFYNPLEKEIHSMVRAISNMGHQIGLHFDAEFYGSNMEGDIKTHLLREKQTIREWFGLDVLALSFHNPQATGLIKLSADSYCGMVSAYGDTLMRTHKYVSDSNGYWRFDRLYDVICSGKYRYLQVLTHPEWWHKEPKTPKQRIKDVIERRAQSSMSEYLTFLKSAGRPDVG